MIIDEISIIGKECFEHLDLALKAIIQNLLPFGGVSFLVVGYFLQLSQVNQKGLFMKTSKGHIVHSMDGYGKNSNCMSCLRLFGRFK